MKKKKIKRQNKSIVSTKEKKWKPTPAMRIWLDAAIRSEYSEVSKIAEECGLDRKNWYNWIKDDNFLLWYKEEWDKRLASQGWRLDKIGLKMAVVDHKYWESMQKRVGNLQDKETVGLSVKDGNKETRIIVTRG